MKLRQRLQEDDAVSPVIGVILMVAITVILAAVIASFVLGMGPNDNTTPTASFDSEYDSSSSELTITLSSAGENIEMGDLELQIDDGDTNFDDVSADWHELQSSGSASSEVTAGSSVTIGDDEGGEDATDLAEDYTVQIVYTGGDGTSVLQSFES